jgi:hypothetical protein
MQTAGGESSGSYGVAIPADPLPPKGIAGPLFKLA